MNPWTIIGWTLIIVITVPMLMRVSSVALVAIVRYVRYRKTRDIPPKQGQRWWQNGSVLTIGERHAKGHFTIHTGVPYRSGASWGETDEEWRNRVRNRRLFLIEP